MRSSCFMLTKSWKWLTMMNVNQYTIEVDKSQRDFEMKELHFEMKGHNLWKRMIARTDHL